MASTRTLFSSLAFTRPFLGYQPLLIASQEPAVTGANMVKQAILGAPCRWKFNRGEVTFATAGVQDYPVVAPDFGFIEKFWLNWEDESGNPQVKEIVNAGTLSAESNVERPASAAVQFDDNFGNITVRLNNRPDQPYTVTVQYQKKASLLTSAASRWSPIPDELSYIYDWGFLAVASLIVHDARYPIFRQNFMSHLLGQQDGLSAQQRNIFVGAFLDSMRGMERATLETQQAVAGRQF